MFDHIIYADTDSLFFSIETFVKEQVGLVKWDTLSIDEKISYSKRIANLVSKYVNTKAYDIIQVADFNSQRKDFKIIFEQEIIASAGLFVAKKKYGFGIVDEAGTRKDEIFIKGLEIIQSLTPITIKPKLKGVLQLIISGASDKVISKTIRVDKKELMTSHPNDIAVNVAAKNLDKYIVNGEAIKGTPWALTGINNYHIVINALNLTKKYDKIGGVGEKIRVVYIKQPNKFGIDKIGFIRWPEEFVEAGVMIDYDLMIDKYYLKKIEHLLDPIGKGHLIYGGDIGGFFT
jgi:DNA polymerase elongation subunit (family B)